jgi:arginine decarboxylase
VGRIQIRRKSDGVHIGGFAAEYEGHSSDNKAKEILHNSLMGIFNRRYSSDGYEYFDEKFNVKHVIVEKKWATVIAVIGFVTYIYPKVVIDNK